MLTMCDRFAGRIIKSFWLPKSHVKNWSLLIWLIWLIGLLVWCLEPTAFSSSESSSRAYPIEKAWSMESPVAGNSRQLPWPPFWSYHSDSVTCLKNSWTFNPVPHQADSPKEWLMQILRYWTAKGIPLFCFQKFIASGMRLTESFILRAHCSWSWIHRTASVIRLAAVKHPSYSGLLMQPVLQRGVGLAQHGEVKYTTGWSVRLWHDKTSLC